MLSAESMTRLFLLFLALASLSLAATKVPTPGAELLARRIYHQLYGVEAIKAMLTYPIQPRLDKVIAYSTAETQVAEIEAIIQQAAENISNDRDLREQLLYEYQSEFTEAELQEYVRWLDSPLSRKIRRFELRNPVIFNPVFARHFRSHSTRVRELLTQAEASTKPRPAPGE
jgi:hypothetical protein